MGNERLDVLLVSRGLIDSREKARTTIMAGLVYVDNQRIDKAGTKIDINSKIMVKGNPLPYVSRGGLKLEKAIKDFKINLKDKICIDIGASTGGFTDCMLQNKAKKIYAIDVGYGQLDWKLRQNNRVIVMERKNIRYVEKDDLDELADFAAIDVSFISLKLVIPVVKNLLEDSGGIVALIKPQFEVGKGKVGKGGVVRELSLHKKVVWDIVDFIQDLGLYILDFTYSPVQGPKGNIEYLLYISKNNEDKNLLDETLINHVLKDSHKNFR